MAAEPHSPRDERRPVRVLWVIKGLGPGGAERLLVTLAKVRDRSAVEYEVAYLLPWKQHLVSTLEDAGVRTHLVGRGKHGGLLWPLRLRRLIARGGFEIVHIHSPALSAVTRVLARSLRQRPATVYTEHNNWRTYGFLTRLPNRWTYGLDARTYAVSRSVHESIVPARRRADVEVLVHGVDSDALGAPRPREQVRAELGLAGDDLVVITVANMRPQKNYPDLLTAAEKVVAARADVHFVAIGQGPMLEDVKQDVRRRGIGRQFHVLGLRDDVFDLLAAADVFVLASGWEGFPIAVMEAMWMGLPCVATRVGGVPDAIVDGVEGLLVDPNDPDRLADALLRLLNDPDSRRAMSAAARSRASAFDIQRTDQTLVAAYRALREQRA